MTKGLKIKKNRHPVTNVQSVYLNNLEGEREDLGQCTIKKATLQALTTNITYFLQKC